MRTSLLVTLDGLAPGAPLGAAVALADALDARRVPLTLLVDARPHPEVADWVRARSRVGDAVLLRPTGEPAAAGRVAAERVTAGPVGGGRAPFRRLPAHEAGLALAGPLRAAEALGVDGFAAPGWACSAGTRRALAAGGVDLVVDDRGVHRLGRDGEPVASCAGPTARAPWSRRRGAAPLVHVRLTVPEVGRAPELVDAALADGAVPATAPALAGRPVGPPHPVRPSRPVRPSHRGPDPEHWSITA